MAWPLKVCSFALLISEAETANLDTSSGEQKLGDVVYTKWRVSLLIVGSFLFRSPPLEVLNLVLKNCLSFEATHSTEPCYVWNWEVKRKKDRCSIPVKDMLSDLILSITWKVLWLAQHDPRDLYQWICITKSANKTQWKSEFTYLWKTYNQSRSPLWNVILFSCSMYFHLFKIAIYLWWRSIRGTTKFQFAFSS